MMAKRLFGVIGLSILLASYFGLAEALEVRTENEGITAEEPLRQRRNFYGMHNLKDGGVEFRIGLEWTRHLVQDDSGEGGYVFDWVHVPEEWLPEVFERGMIPCMRVQNTAGGDPPEAWYASEFARQVMEFKTTYEDGKYADRLVYMQLHNEPADPRDWVEPEVLADFMVAAYDAIKAHDTNDTLRVMTPAQNGPDFWDRVFTHNPDAVWAFDVWATHPYPESYPPHYNHHDGVAFTNVTKTIDTYLFDLDIVAQHGRRGFPVMITETAYGDHLGISYEGYPKTTRQMAADYNVAAFTEYWHKWPEIIAIHPFILHNYQWEAFAWVKGMGVPTDSNPDGSPAYPYPQYTALRNIPKPPPARMEPYRGPVGTIRGTITRRDTGEPITYATVFTDGYEFGGPSLFDGIYVVRDIPVGTYTLCVNKVGYQSANAQITVNEGQETVTDFELVYMGKVSKGIYFQNKYTSGGTCDGCDLYAPFLGQTFKTPDDVGFIKFAAAMPNVGDVTMKFSILEGGPDGPQVGESVTAYLEPKFGGEMIGAEWPEGYEPQVEPNRTYFLKVERDDGQSVYCYATDDNPYPDGMAYTGMAPHPGWDLFATIRGLTVEEYILTGHIAGAVTDISGTPISGATVATNPGGYSAMTNGNGHYTIENVPVGTYSVAASNAGYSTETQGGVVIEQSETTIVDFMLEEATTGSIRGTVIDTSDNPIAGAHVETTTGGYSATTDSNGNYTLNDVVPGTYTVRATKAGYLPDAQSDISVASEQTTTVNFRLVPIGAETPVVENMDFEDDGGFFTVARGWTSFGGNKWEVVWSPERSFTQGVCDIPPSSVGGVYQTVQVTPGTRYRISVYAKTTIPDYEVSVGVTPAGGTNPDAATFSAASTSESWTRLTVDFTATGPVATIFLRARNTRSWFFGGWAQFDEVTIEVLGTGNAPPTAVASANPTEGEAPLLVQFDGTASSDPDGDTLSYDWNFGDGTQSGSGATTSHTFTAEGVYDVILTVADGRGGSDSDTLTVTVSGVGPETPVVENADFEGDGGFFTVARGWTSFGGNKWEVVWDPERSFTQGVCDISPNSICGIYQTVEVTPGTRYRVSVYGKTTTPDYEVAVGVDPAGGTNPDAATFGAASTSESWTRLTVDFTATGPVATIFLRARNTRSWFFGGWTQFDEVTIEVLASDNAPPTAVVSANPTEGEAPLLVQFDGTGSSDPDGDALGYDWDFGDGTPHGSGGTTSHTYETPGTYAATLTVNDGNGGSDSTSLTIVVNGSVYGGSKLTIHTGCSPNCSLSMNFVNTAKPRVIKILDSFSVASEIKRASPETKIIGRIFLQNWPMDGDPVQRAQEWWNNNKNIILGYPEIDYWEGYNEPVIAADQEDKMRWYAQFEAERVRILADYGLKACIGNFSTGNPDLGLWPAFYEAIDEAMKYDGILGLHEYGTPMQQYFDFESGLGHLCGLYRRVYRTHLIPDNKVIPLAITECGVDGVAPVGWKNHFTEEEYIDQLIWYDNLIKEDDYVLGTTIFALEIPGWDDFDIADIMDWLGDYVGRT